jgi:hypothetical protein
MLLDALRVLPAELCLATGQSLLPGDKLLRAEALSPTHSPTGCLVELVATALAVSSFLSTVQVLLGDFSVQRKGTE